jgi:hypothetical protein
MAGLEKAMSETNTFNMTSEIVIKGFPGAKDTHDFVVCNLPGRKLSGSVLRMLPVIYI